MGIIEKHAEILNFEDIRGENHSIGPVNFFDSHDILHYVVMSSVYSALNIDAKIKMFILPFFQGNKSFVESFLVKLQDNVLSEGDFNSKEELEAKIEIVLNRILSKSEIYNSIATSIKKLVNYVYDENSFNLELKIDKKNILKITYQMVESMSNNRTELCRAITDSLINFSSFALTKIEGKSEIDALKTWSFSQGDIPYTSYQVRLQTLYHLEIDDLIEQGIINIPDEAYARFTAEQFEVLDEVLGINYIEKESNSFE